MPARSCRASKTPIKLPTSVPRPPETAAPPTTTAAIACNSRPVPALGSTSTNLTALSKRRQAGERTHRHEHAEHHALWTHARQSRGLGIRARRVHRAPRREVSQGPSERREDRQRRRQHDPLTGRLSRTEPLESRSRIPHELAFATPAQHLSQNHERRQCHHDRRQAESRHEHAVDRPQCAPAAHVPNATTGIGSPALRQQTRDDPAHRELRSDRDIDLPAHDDQRHPHRRDQHRRPAHGERAQLIGPEELPARTPPITTATRRTLRRPKSRGDSDSYRFF